MVRVLCHGVVLAAWLYTAGYDYAYIPNFGRRSWLHKLLYVTQINLMVQTAYFCISLARSALDWLAERGERAGRGRRHARRLPVYWDETRTHRLVDTVYATTAFPLALLTFAVFWCMRAVGERPVPLGDALVPKWYNHMLHTAPLFFMLFDTLLQCHRMPTGRLATAIVLAQAAAYAGAQCAARLVDGRWPYAVLDALPAHYAAVVVLAAAAGLYPCYALVDALNRLVWGVAAHSEERREARRSVSADGDEHDDAAAGAGSDRAAKPHAE